MSAFFTIPSTVTLLFPSHPIPSRHLSLSPHSIPTPLSLPPTHHTNTTIPQLTSFSSKKNKKPRSIPRVAVRSQLRYPIISPHDHWATWSTLFAIGAFGLWSEKTKIGSMVSAALVSTLVGLAASNLGILPFDAPAYSVVLEFLLPISIPLLLFRANLKQVLSSTGTLLSVFLLGSGDIDRNFMYPEIFPSN